MPRPTSLPDRLAVCHRCPDREPSCAGMCRCTVDGVDIIEHAATAACPLGLFEAAAAAAAIERVVSAGADLWDELHGRPHAFRGDAAAELRFLFTDLRGRVAAIACDCSGHLAAYFDRHPPRLSSPAAYALWTFDLHVSVNLRLGRPGLTLAGAADRHRWWEISGFDVGLLPAVAA